MVIPAKDREFKSLLPASTLLTMVIVSPEIEISAPSEVMPINTAQYIDAQFIVCCYPTTAALKSFIFSFTKIYSTLNILLDALLKEVSIIWTEHGVTKN